MSAQGGAGRIEFYRVECRYKVGTVWVLVWGSPVGPSSDFMGEFWMFFEKGKAQVPGKFFRGPAADFDSFMACGRDFAERQIDELVQMDAVTRNVNPPDKKNLEKVTKRGFWSLRNGGHGEPTLEAIGVSSKSSTVKTLAKNLLASKPIVITDIDGGA